jgi:hypothetical protein
MRKNGNCPASQQTYRAAVTRNDFLKARSGLDSASAIGRR